MRPSVIVCLLSLVAAINCKSHDMSEGEISDGDVILYKVNKHKNGFPLVVRTSIVRFPEPGKTNHAIITAINIKDHDPYDVGGNPSIIAGGVGQHFVKIRLQSKVDYGFNFTITIYGRVSGLLVEEIFE